MFQQIARHEVCTVQQVARKPLFFTLCTVRHVACKLLFLTNTSHEDAKQSAHGGCAYHITHHYVHKSKDSGRD
jgi:hypothetical protein